MSALSSLRNSIAKASMGKTSKTGTPPGHRYWNRRRLREALRVMAPSFQPGWDVLIIARPAIVEADHEALVGALRRTLVRGGVIEGAMG